MQVLYYSTLQSDSSRVGKPHRDAVNLRLNVGFGRECSACPAESKMKPGTRGGGTNQPEENSLNGEIREIREQSVN